ncbi:hypothetical protein [Novipirellula caenicola]|uniref:Uncharacterized protein n=1 Tax=Novipirellula caenicola TaxID=1536901 RepID=A0ABP9VK65_9BACT
MDTDEAIRVLRKHNGELDDETDTLLNCLRPYSKIDTAHFSEIVKALYFAAPLLNTPEVHRDLVHTIWDLTRSARLWTRGPREPMFHGRNFISDDDKKTLDRWIYEIESITLCLLRGFEDWEAISGLAEELNHHDSIVDTSGLVSPFTKSLDYHLDMENHGGFGDDEEILCDALIKIGPDASPAIPVLQRLGSSTKYPNVKSSAENTISILKKNNDAK